MRQRLRILGRLAVAVSLVSGALLVASAGPASAVACTSPVRYAASSNTIYLVTAQSFTLSDIVANCPSAPLTLVDPVSHTWELSADLVLQNGSALVLRGTANGGDVDTLRIRSLADNSLTHVQQIMAYYGTITIDATRVTSWDDDAGAPDVDPSLPDNAGSTDRGRAFIRALSYLDTDGVTPRESALYISDSEVDHLGYYGAEAYGVAYKTRGCDHTNLTVCTKVGVYGSQTHSHFHDNFMGTYTWGAKNIPFTYNEYDHNFMYGLDPHDVSINLLIDHNHFHDNGDHGVICSQLCDHLTITNNESDHNGMVPFMGPTGDSDTAGQVHGIMIHRGVTNTVIADNYVHDQPNGAGIAVFDSAGNTITNNTVVGAEYGLRVSVGSAGNSFTNNTVSNSTQYAIFLYKGSDLPSYTTMTGHPTGNLFDANTISGTTSNAVKLTEADQNTFSNSTYSNLGGSLLFNLSAGNVISNLTLPGNQKISVTGSTAEPGSLVLTSPPAPVSISVDSNSVADVTSPTGQLASIKGLKTTVGSTGSTLHLTSTLLGGTTGVTLTPQKVTVKPASGTALAIATGTGAGTQVTLSGGTAGVAVTFGIGGLTANTLYTVTRNGTVVATATTNGAGLLSFTDTPPGTGGYTYVVS